MLLELRLVRSREAPDLVDLPLVAGHDIERPVAIASAIRVDRPAELVEPGSSDPRERLGPCLLAQAVARHGRERVEQGFGARGGRRVRLETVRTAGEQKAARRSLALD